LQDVLVDAAQTSDATAGAKLVQHPRIGQAVAVRQLREAAPRPLFGQQREQQIELVHRRQDRQQMQPPQLGGMEQSAAATSPVRWPKGVDEIVGNMRCQSMQQGGGACGWK